MHLQIEMHIVGEQNTGLRECAHFKKALYDISAAL